MATVLTDAGRDIITNRIKGSGTEPKYVAWGTAVGTAAHGDIILFTESPDEARTSGTSSRTTTSVANDTYQVVGTITCATNNKTITNMGLFDASSSGNLFIHGDFTGVALVVGDSITATFTITF